MKTSGKIGETKTQESQQSKLRLSNGEVLVRSSTTLTISRNYQSISRQFGLEKVVPSAEEGNEFSRQTEAIENEVAKNFEDMGKTIELAERFKEGGE